MGTKYEFPKEDHIALIDDVKLRNVPEILATNDETVDHTATIIVLMLLFLSLILAILIAMFLVGCKERSLFILRELDVLAITGGRRKKVVGGIMMIFFVLCIVLIWSGYLINYIVYNERRESSETSNPFMQKDLPSSYEIELIVYASKVKESNAPFLIFNATAGEKNDANPDDLCEKTGHQISESFYFKNANQTTSECVRKRLNEFTDAYTIKLAYKNLPRQEIENQFINLDMNFEYTHAVHFFHWKFRTVWCYGYMDMATAYSEVEGIMTPQTVRELNKNITSAFKGPMPNILDIALIPTHYVNEVESVVHKGYRTHLVDVERGSTVNKRTLVNRYSATGDELKGFSIMFRVNNGNMLYQVRIQKIRSILEVLAYMFGFLAGFVLLVRGAKYYLLKETYFLELEKQ